MRKILTAVVAFFALMLAAAPESVRAIEYSNFVGAYNNNSSASPPPAGQTACNCVISHFAAWSGQALAKQQGFNGTGVFAGPFVTQAQATALYKAALSAGLLQSLRGIRGPYDRERSLRGSALV